MINLLILLIIGVIIISYQNAKSLDLILFIIVYDQSIWYHAISLSLAGWRLFWRADWNINDIRIRCIKILHIVIKIKRFYIINLAKWRDLINIVSKEHFGILISNIKTSQQFRVFIPVICIMKKKACKMNDVNYWKFWSRKDISYIYVIYK